jgi:hypothetical protein
VPENEARDSVPDAGDGSVAREKRVSADTLVGRGRVNFEDAVRDAVSNKFAADLEQQSGA